MRIGLIARASNTGLGTLSYEFARHLKPAKVLIITNGVEKTFPERYSESEVKRAIQPFFIHPAEMEWLTEGVDLILSFETFYTWSIISIARRKGVKTVLVTMAELFPETVPIYPDLFICPSKLDMDIVPDPKVFLPIPVAIDRLHWVKRYRADRFIHSASHGGISGRKGTGLLIEAMKHVKKDIKLTIYTWQGFEAGDPRIDVQVVNFKNYWQLWREGDVLIYPQGANGICLPIVEAMSCGLGVITTDIYPFNEYMPKELLFKPDAYTKRRFGGNLKEVNDPVMSPEVLAAKIDEVAGSDISEYSEYGRQWREENSWDVLLPRYIETFQKLCG